MEEKLNAMDLKNIITLEIMSQEVLKARECLNFLKDHEFIYKDIYDSITQEINDQCKRHSLHITTTFRACHDTYRGYYLFMKCLSGKLKIP